MKLESQVVSLELSKRLKELGVKQESLWVWEGSDDTEWYIAASVASGSNIYAYSVAELGEMLPVSIFNKKGNWIGDLAFYPRDKEYGWSVAYVQGTQDGGDEIITYLDELISKASDTEANARALMLIYLLENKLLTL